MAHRLTIQDHEAPLDPPASRPVPGVWPANPFELPYLLSEDELARLLNRSVRTLQRRRRRGQSPPFTKHGKQILYRRDSALAYYAGVDEPSTAQAAVIPRG